MTEETGARAVRRVTRTIELIAERGGVRIDDVADELQIHRSSASRLLASLRGMSWVVANQERTWFTLGPRLITIGRAAVPDSGLETGLELAKQLRDAYDESVHLAVLDRGAWTTTVVAVVESRQALRVSLPVGARDQLHSTAGGKVFLAALPDDVLDAVLGELDLAQEGPNTVTSAPDLLKDLAAVRARGYATNVEESRAGVCSGAVLLGDLADPEGQVALSVTSPAGRCSPEELGERMADVVARHHGLLCLPGC